MGIAAGFSGCGTPSRSSLAAIRASASQEESLPSLRPDYSGVTVPMNIGPLNCLVGDACIRVYARIFSEKGDTIEVLSKNSQIIVPPKQWHSLLAINAGATLKIDLYAQESNGSWRRYRRVENPISGDRIDPYVMYRTLTTLYRYSRDLTLFQRNLETNEEREMLNALNYFPGCCNCHTFRNNDPSNAFFHIRTQDYGNSALLVTNGTVGKIDAKFGYTTWHPSGKVVVYSVNKVDQCFHAAWKDPRDAFDFTSGLKVYLVEKKKIVTVPQIYNKEALETWPCWSPDGKYLYFSSGLILWPDSKTYPPVNLEKTRYSLMRISYDITTDTWGTIDTVLSANATGKSMTEPRVSPDGRFLLFCMHNYGPSPYLQPSSDLCLLDLATGKWEPLAEANSQWSESWHSWSSSSRWIAFTSKRGDGILGRIYFCHIDQNGKASKPFVMPQNDPAFYDAFIKTYNVPELAIGPFTVPQADLVAAIKSQKKLDVIMPDAVTNASPKQPPSPPKTE
jgi:hypothetical protein